MTTAINNSPSPTAPNVRVDKNVAATDNKATKTEAAAQQKPAVQATVSSAADNQKISDLKEKLVRLQAVLDNLSPDIKEAVESALRNAGNINRLRQDTLGDVFRSYRQLADKLTSGGEDLKQAMVLKQQLPEGVADKLGKVLINMLQPDIDKVPVMEKQMAPTGKSNDKETSQPIINKLQQMTGLTEKEIIRLLPMLSETLKKADIGTEKKLTEDTKLADIKSFLKEAMVEAKSTVNAEKQNLPPTDKQQNLPPTDKQQSIGSAANSKANSAKDVVGNEEGLKNLASLIRNMADNNGITANKENKMLAPANQSFNEGVKQDNSKDVVVTANTKLLEVVKEVLSSVKVDGRVVTADSIEKFTQEVLQKLNNITKNAANNITGNSNTSKQLPLNWTEQQRPQGYSGEKPNDLLKSILSNLSADKTSENKQPLTEKQMIAQKILDLLNTQVSPDKTLKTAADMQETAKAIGRLAQVQGEGVEGKPTANFDLPLVAGEQEKIYAAQIKIQGEQDEKNGKRLRDTWLRMNIDTENIGVVDVVFHLNLDNKLDVKVLLSDNSVVENFNAGTTDLQKILASMPFNQASINGIQWLSKNTQLGN